MGLVGSEVDTSKGPVGSNPTLSANFPIIIVYGNIQ